MEKRKLVTFSLEVLQKNAQSEGMQTDKEVECILAFDFWIPVFVIC